MLLAFTWRRMVKSALLAPSPKRLVRFCCFKSIFVRAVISPSQRYRILANTRHQPNVVPMLSQRRRWWHNIGTTLGRCLVFAGMHIGLRCKAKRQYLLTIQVSRYDLLALQSSMLISMSSFELRFVEICILFYIICRVSLL